MPSAKQRVQRCPTAAQLLGGQTRGIHVWKGMSGRNYSHTIYSLIGCPPLSESNIVLARRTADGDLHVLHIDRVDDASDTLNLAYIRQLGATLGATEVHVHAMATSYADRARIEMDIRSNLTIGDRSLVATLSH
jgi:hypothetical protein